MIFNTNRHRKCFVSGMFQLTTNMASKRQHRENNLKLKYEALIELQKGKSNKEVSFETFREGHLAKRVKGLMIKSIKPCLKGR